MVTTFQSLAELEEDYNQLERKGIADIIQRGKILIEIQRRLEHGEFVEWIEEHFELSKSSAYRYIAAARFANIFPTVGNLKLRPTALYPLLSRRKSARRRRWA